MREISCLDLISLVCKYVDLSLHAVQQPYKTPRRRGQACTKLGRSGLSVEWTSGLKYKVIQLIPRRFVSKELRIFWGGVIGDFALVDGRSFFGRQTKQAELSSLLKFVFEYCFDLPAQRLHDARILRRSEDKSTFTTLYLLK